MFSPFVARKGRGEKKKKHETTLARSKKRLAFPVLVKLKHSQTRVR